MDATYYVNLAHRADRRTQLEAQLAQLGWPAERVDAIHVPQRGALGCAMSHAVALRRFIASSARHALVLEDDVVFTRDPRPAVARFLADHAEAGWDVLMLASNTVAEAPVAGRDYVTRILNAQTTSAYAVSREFAPELLACFERSAIALQSEHAHAHCCDIMWKALQPGSRWYCLRPKVAMQRPGFSDIEGRVTCYNV